MDLQLRLARRDGCAPARLPVQVPGQGAGAQQRRVRESAFWWCVGSVRPIGVVLWPDSFLSVSLSPNGDVLGSHFPVHGDLYAAPGRQPRARAQVLPGPLELPGLRARGPRGPGWTEPVIVFESGAERRLKRCLCV